MEHQYLNIKDRKFNETYFFEDEGIRSGELKILVNAYPLQSLEFERLINSWTGYKKWSLHFLLIGIGALVVLISKILDFFIVFNKVADRNNIALEIKNYEWLTICIALGLYLILLTISLVCKDRKDKLIKKIKTHLNID